MRSREELFAEAVALGIPVTMTERKEDLMDLIRTRLGLDDELQIDPMKAVDLKNEIDWTADDPFSRITRFFNDDYRMEPKLDGARMRLFLGIGPGGSNRMNTGRRSDRTKAYIERSDNFRHLRDHDFGLPPGTVLDGEILSPKRSIDTGRTITQGLLNSSVALVNTNADDSWAIQEREGHALFHIFDILRYANTHYTSSTYTARRGMLVNLAPELESLEQVNLVPSTLPSAEAIHDFCNAGYEGVMIKDTNGRYEAGKRSRAWLKVKRMHTVDAFINGRYEHGKGRNTGQVGALKISVYDELGLEVEIGQVGAFTDEFRAEISAPDGSVSPEWKDQVLEVMFQEITKEKRLRHPQLVRIRPDKTASECTLDQLDGATVA